MSDFDVDSYLNDIEDIFSPDGWLHVNGYSYREEQACYAQDVAVWLTSCSTEVIGDKTIHRNVAFLEADTGIGKTVGYLIPLLMRHGKSEAPVVVSTYTINLQKQIIESDLDIARACVEEHLGQSIKLARKLGVRQFVSVERLALRKSELFEYVKPTQEWLVFETWLKESVEYATATFEEWYEEYGLELPCSLKKSDLCVLDSTEEHQAIRRMNDDVRDADIIVTSHASLIMDVTTGGRVLNSANRMPVAIVLDEGDKAVEAANDYFKRRLQIAEIARKVSDLKTKSKHKKDTLTLLKEFDAFLRKLDDKINSAFILKKDGNKESDLVIHEYCEALAKKLFFLSQNKYHSCEASAKEMSELSNHIAEYSVDITSNSKMLSCRAIAFSDKRRIPSLMTTNEFSGAVFNYYSKRGCPVAYTSATLSDGQSEPPPGFGGFRYRIKTAPNSILMERSYSPKVYGKVEIELPPKHTKKPFISSKIDEESTYSEEWVNYVLDTIVRASALGNTLVLVPSFREARMFADRLSGGHNILCHEKGEPISTVASRYLSQGGVLITPSMWEGVSLRHRDGSQFFDQLVITRLPYPPLDRAAEQVFVYHRLKDYPSETISGAKSKYFVSSKLATVRKTKQGFGRLIRNKYDTGKVWFCDPRMPTQVSDPGEKNDLLLRIIPNRFVIEYHRALLRPYPISLRKKEAA